jgi:hypothetical protein
MTKIVIGLAAVVILGLVVVLLAIRFRRPDEGDDVGQLPDERGGAPSRDRHARDRMPHPDLPQVAAARGSRRPDDEPRRAGRDSAHRGQRAASGYDRGQDDRGQDDRGQDDRTAALARARRDDRRGDDAAAQRRAGSQPAAKTRTASRKRSGTEGDWPSTDWDALSDVDYWAELTSDRPLTTTAQPAASSRAARSDERQHNRPAARRTAPSRPDQIIAAPTTGGAEQQESSRRPAVAAAEPSLAVLASMASDQSGQRGLPAVDDDPLTSPSFPRVSASDSRSYNSGRINIPVDEPRRTVSRDEATQQFPNYGSASPERSSGYSAPTQRQPGIHPGIQPGGSGTPAGGYRPAPPAADPLGLPAFPPAASVNGYGDRGGLAGQEPVSGGYRARRSWPDAGAGQPPAPLGPSDHSSSPYGAYGRSVSAPGSPAVGYSTPSALDVPSGESLAGYRGQAGGGGAQPDRTYPAYPRPDGLSRDPAASPGPDPAASPGRGGWYPELPVSPGQNGSFPDAPRRKHGAPGGAALNGTDYQPTSYPAQQPYDADWTDPAAADPYGYPGYGTTPR